MVTRRPVHGSPSARGHRTLPLFLPLLLVVSACCPNTREAKNKIDPLDFSGSSAAKVDPELRRSAAKLLADDQGDDLLSVLVRVTESEARDSLEAAGMRVESVVGTIVTGKIPARALAEVAALDAVIEVKAPDVLEIK